MSEKNRVFFYGIIGAYLVYLSYDMFQSKASQGEVPMMLFGILFAVAGVILLIVTVRSFKKVFMESEAEEESTEATSGMEEEK